MRSAVRADPATTMAPVVVATRMPPAACGRTCDRPDGRSSTTADRPADDCAAHRAASRRALCERIRQRDCRCQHQEKQQPSNPMHRALLKTFDFLRLRAAFLAGRKRESTYALPPFSTSCEATGSPVCADIECNDNVASVNAAPGQVVHDACWFVRGRCRERGSRAESQSGGFVPCLATTVIGSLSAQEIPRRVDRRRRQA
jgi:hypothetical protein